MHTGAFKISLFLFKHYAYKFRLIFTSDYKIHAKKKNRHKDSNINKYFWNAGVLNNTVCYPIDLIKKKIARNLQWWRKKQHFNNYDRGQNAKIYSPSAYQIKDWHDAENKLSIRNSSSVKSWWLK